MPKSNPIFSKNLIFWYLENKRALPWRTTNNPYHIWLSEIILQQTRVEQGLPYYQAFLLRFPTINSLAMASEGTVLKLWQGLGYYSRARNLHVTAKYISTILQGKFPNKYKELIKLKGVGDYTASAIASICFNEATAVVDGNVYRVLSRIFGIFTPINSSNGQKEFKKLAQNLIDITQSGTHNQAIMEFGTRYCKPQNPDCNRCIFNKDCLAHQKNMVHDLPVKQKKATIKKYYFNYLVLLSEGTNTLIQQRTSKGIWQHLFEFPLIKTSAEIDMKEFKKTAEFKKYTRKYLINEIHLYNEKSIIHKLSHQHLITRFWVLNVSDLPLKITNKMNEKGESSLIKIPFSRIHEYPVPVLIENFIDHFWAQKNHDKYKKNSYI